MSGRLAALTLFLALGANLFGGCSDNTPTCIPAAVLNDCICSKGDRGHRVCDSDGLHFGACVCGTLGSGGASGAAGMANAGNSSMTGGSDSNGGATE